MSLILVIEDEDVMASTLKDILEAEGFDVLTARNGADGLRLLTEKRPDLVLLDLMLPILGGPAFLEGKARDPDAGQVPVVAMTSASRAVLGAHAVDGFLQKPFLLTDLLGEVHRLLRGDGEGEGEDA